MISVNSQRASRAHTFWVFQQLFRVCFFYVCLHPQPFELLKCFNSDCLFDSAVFPLNNKVLPKSLSLCDRVRIKVI